MARSSEADAVDQERRLLAQVARGDRAAFRELYTRYSEALLGLIIRMVGDVPEAEELLQDALVKIWRAARDFDPEKSRPFTWAVTIVRRTCIDHLRRRARRPQVESFERVAERSATETAAASPREAAVWGEDAARVRTILDGMPAAQRDALELTLFSGLTHSEIADRLKQPVGTIKSWIRRGLLELRSGLKPYAP